MAAFAFVCVVFAHALAVGLYAESVPFWDQWDSEGATLLKPRLESTLQAVDLLAPHNEHRVLYTRLLTLALFEANSRQWDNLIGAYANTLLIGAIAAACYVCFASLLRSRGSRLLLLGGTVVLFAWPCAWENTLVGFQSAFYWLILFAIGTLALSSVAASWLAMIGTLGLAVASVVTLASGVFAAVAAAGILVLRCWCRDLTPRRAWPAVVSLTVVAVVGYLWIPVLPGAVHMPDGPLGLLKSLSFALRWPLPSAWGLLLWMPTVVKTWETVRTRRVSPGTTVALGLSAWVMLQCLAIAYSRGVGMVDPAPRYCDVLLVGLLANLALVLGWAAGRPLVLEAHSMLRAGLAAVFVIALGSGVWLRWPGDVEAMRGRAYLSTIQTGRVRTFVRDSDPTILDAPLFHIPYPSSHRLTWLLMDPTIRQILPSTVRRSLIHAEPSPAATGDQSIWDSVGTCRSRACSPETGVWKSPSMRSSFPFIRLTTVRGGGGPKPKIGLFSQFGAAWETLPDQTTRVSTLSVPPGPFQIVMEDTSPSGWVAIDQAVEIGRLSLWARKLKTSTRRWAGVEW